MSATWLTPGSFCRMRICSESCRTRNPTASIIYGQWFASSFLVDADTSLLENIVAVTLRRKYGDGSYFWNSRNAEVDFVIPEEELAIQVSYSMADPDTFRRETDGLIKLSSVQNVKRMIVVTKDEEDIVEKDGCRIEIIPLWKWLLEF